MLQRRPINFLREKKYFHFPLGHKYWSLLKLVHEEYRFWSQLKNCYLKQRRDLKAQNVCVIRIMFIIFISTIMHVLGISRWVPHNQLNMSL